MAYFCTGSEGDDFRERYCERCVHDLNPQGCAIWHLQQLWNYETQGKTPEGAAKHFALNALISDASGLCRHFHEATPQEISEAKERKGRAIGKIKPAPWIADWLAKRPKNQTNHEAKQSLRIRLE